MKIEVSERPGVYFLNGIHDGFLCGISVNDDKELRLDFKSLQGSPGSLIVSGVQALKADNFLQGNIVFDVDIYQAEFCPQEFLARVYGYNEAQAESYLPAVLQALEGLPWILIEVSASYGCELYALSVKSVDELVVLTE